MLRRTFSLAVLGGLSLPAFAATIPRQAGEAAIALADGKQELLSKYRGKTVILSFILTT